jgi:nucleotide-binding universal stress UspA family protein
VPGPGARGASHAGLAGARRARFVASAGWPGNRRAAEIAGAIAGGAGGNVTLLHVSSQEPREARRELAQEATDLFCLTGTEPVIRTTPGKPAKAIADAAREHGATLLILGSRGLPGARALASVSERVGATAPCPVLVLRPRQTS